MSPLMESLASFKGSGSETAISKEASAPAGTVEKPQVQRKQASSICVCWGVFFWGVVFPKLAFVWVFYWLFVGLRIKMF